MEGPKWGTNTTYVPVFPDGAEEFVFVPEPKIVAVINDDASDSLRVTACAGCNPLRSSVLGR